MFGHKGSLLLTQGNQTGIFYYKHIQLSLSLHSQLLELMLKWIPVKEQRSGMNQANATL